MFDAALRELSVSNEALTGLTVPVLLLAGLYLLAKWLEAISDDDDDRHIW